MQITKTLFCIKWGLNQFNLALRCAGSVLFHPSFSIWLTLRIVLRYTSCLCLQILLRARNASTRLVSSPVLHCLSSCYVNQKTKKMQSELQWSTSDVPPRTIALQRLLYLNQETTLLWQTEIVRYQLVGMSQDSTDDCGLCQTGQQLVVGWKQFFRVKKAENG